MLKLLAAVAVVVVAVADGAAVAVGTGAGGGGGGGGGGAGVRLGGRGRRRQGWHIWHDQSGVFCLSFADERFVHFRWSQVLQVVQRTDVCLRSIFLSHHGQIQTGPGFRSMPAICNKSLSSLAGSGCSFVKHSKKMSRELQKFQNFQLLMQWHRCLVNRKRWAGVVWMERLISWICVVAGSWPPGLAGRYGVEEPPSIVSRICRCKSFRTQ